ncbi:MAG TPA: SDR family oxidoreductase [Ideonella sp.]|uniref:SDR family oxidoreductase n=1 Tax=Ideonella sp. TaxID=1929293 RepID=UPI002BC4BAA5|nr:SDR family oxidoreductase [Ideonella sp.]HSI47515.1 SDR family oxidoreductase [Ideonella sp.]
MFSNSPNPVVVLTGASSGIGRASALALARQGARLVLAARGRDGLESIAAECRAFGAETLIVPTDVTDATMVQALADAAIGRFGGIDVWINNVGVGAVGRFEETPAQAHRRIIETNLIGQMNGAHAVVPHFRQRQQGTLINMISLGGWTPTPFATAYTASKFGLRGFSEALRAELSELPDVHVCAVYPTFVDTPGFMHGANYTGKHLKPPSPLVDPREVALLIADLVRHPRPTVSIGSVAWPARLAHALAPDLVARTTYGLMDRSLASADPAPMGAGNLFAPSQNHAIDGGYRDARHAAARKLGAYALGALAVLALAALRPRARRTPRLA